MTKIVDTTDVEEAAVEDMDVPEDFFGEDMELDEAGPQGMDDWIASILGGLSEADYAS